MSGIEKEMELKASLENLDSISGFVEEELCSAGCPMKIVMQVLLCVEEIFVNVTSYAYAPETGMCLVKLVTENNDGEGKLTITISDSGKPFNPLLKEDPDITLSADERKIGGLGIFMVKKTMDSVDYDYISGKNVLKMVKSWKK